MKSIIRGFLLFFFLLLMFFGCNQEKKQDKMKITIHAPENASQKIKIGFVKSFNFNDSTLAETKLDSSGVGFLEFNISKPVLAYLKLETKNNLVYIAPGYNSKISINHTDSDQNTTFTGDGAIVNNYLLNISLLREKYIRAGGKYIWELDQDALFVRLDSMRSVFELFHRNYTDSVDITKALSNSLKKKNRLELVVLKENYDLVHYNDNNNKLSASGELKRKKPENAAYQIPFDTTYFNDPIVAFDYANALKMYLDLYVNEQAYSGIPEEEKAASNEIMPIITDRFIRKKEFPNKIKEFLIAKNIDSFLASQGISAATDTIFNHFKIEYSNSEYIEAIENRYNKWRKIKSGHLAPDFTGITPEGKKISLSDLKGKVVYVDVWATWCGPCRKEIPYAKQLQKQFKGNNNVVFLYVSLDNEYNKWKKFLQEDEDFSGTHIIVDTLQDVTSSIREAYIINGIPRYILIDNEGKIVNANASPPSSDDIKVKIEELLKSSTL